MIPITRKELYLNKIVGNNEYETPEKPISEEEFFFAEILGEAVQAPEPLTRYQMYLAKIAGRNIEIPTPITRLEHFLARAAGVDITVPVPITREEMFWADYALIELNGIPPLIFKSDGSALKNYRIYGAAGGVGDYDEESGKHVIPVTVSGKNLLNHIVTNRVIDQTLTVVVNNDRSITVNGASSSTQSINIIQDFIPQSGYTYILSGCPSGGSYSSYTMDMLNNSGIIRADSGNGTSFNADDRIGTLRIRIRIAANFTCNNLTFYPMIRLANAGNSAYEPYTESATINIFLDEPVYEGESVSMADTGVQFGTIDGTNILTVGTAVQPSGIEIKGRIQEVTEKTFEVNFYNSDTLLETAQNVAYNGTATYTGSTPAKASTAQYDYTFAGWTKTQGSTTVDADALTGVTADRNVYAVFTATARSYTVTFMNASTLMDTQTVTYGGTVVYGGTTPTKAETSEYTYTFAGWNINSSASTADADALTNVTADRTVYAIFTAVPKGYTVYFYNGETLLETVTGVPSGGTATYTGATPTSSQAGYIFSGWLPSNTNITADTSCYAQFVDEDMYESISDTWSEIIANVSNGTYSTKYHIGDTKKIDLGTEGEVIMQIAGIDADDLADNSGKAPITWISKQLLKTDHRMNPAKQSGKSGTGALGGWEKTEMRSYLKEIVKPLLPSEVRNALKTVKKYSRICNTSGTVLNNIVSNDDIWIPSAYEVNFSNYETSGVTYSSAFPDNASRIKHKVGDSAAWWWLRSASGPSSFRAVSSDGGANSNTANNSDGVAVGFCT